MISEDFHVDPVTKTIRLVKEKSDTVHDLYDWLRTLSGSRYVLTLNNGEGRIRGALWIRSDFGVREILTEWDEWNDEVLEDSRVRETSEAG